MEGGSLRKCKMCGEPLPQGRRVFCSDRCYKRDGGRKDKIFKREKRIRDREAKYNCPIWACPRCGKKVRLKFSPNMNKMRWLNHRCSNCGYRVSNYHERLSEIKVKEELRRSKKII